MLLGPCVFAAAHTSRFHGVPELARLDKMALQAFPGRHGYLGCVKTNCGSVVRIQGFGMWKRIGEQNWVMLQRRKEGRVVSFAAADEAGTHGGFE